MRSLSVMTSPEGIRSLQASGRRRTTLDPFFPRFAVCCGCARCGHARSVMMPLGFCCFGVPRLRLSVDLFPLLVQVSSNRNASLHESMAREKKIPLLTLPPAAADLGWLEFYAPRNRLSLPFWLAHFIVHIRKKKEN